MKFTTALMKSIYRVARKFFNNLFPLKYMDLEEEKQFLIFEDKIKYNVDLQPLDCRWRKKFEFVNSMENGAYIMHYPKSCYIEPIFGYAISGRNEYMLHSKAGSYGFLFGSKNDKTSPPDRFVFTLKKSKAIKLGKAISLNMHANFGKNYYSAYNGVLGQLTLLESNGVDVSLPVIIPKSMFETKFFQQIIQLSDKLKNINWIIRDDLNYSFNNAKYFECSELYTAMAIPYLKKYLLAPLTLFDNIQPAIDEQDNRKIFLTRADNKARHIRNNKEILSVVSSLGFEIIDTENMTVKQQILLFRNVSMAIVLHGAGNVNMIFRYPKHLKLLEVHTSDYYAGGYMIMANEFGFGYDVFVGSNLDGGTHSVSSFYIDPALFELKIKEWMK